MFLHPIQYYQSLKQSKNRKINNCFLIEGPKIIVDVLSSSGEIQEILLDKAKEKTLKMEYPSIFQFSNLRVLESRTFEKLSDTVHSQGVLAVLPVPKETEFQKKSIMIMNGIQDPGNAGTIIRTAVAFGVNQFLIDSNTADLYGPKVLRSSAGAIVYSNIQRSESLIEEAQKLQLKGFHLYALEADSPKTLEEVRVKQPFGLIVGSEGSGIQSELKSIADEKVSIKIQNMDSLNAAVAASIFLYEISRRKE